MSRKRRRWKDYLPFSEVRLDDESRFGKDARARLQKSLAQQGPRARAADHQSRWMQENRSVEFRLRAALLVKEASKHFYRLKASPELIDERVDATSDSEVWAEAERLAVESIAKSRRGFRSGRSVQAPRGRLVQVAIVLIAVMLLH